VAVSLVCVGALTAGQAQGQTRTPASNQAPMVLFMCPHGAAKSVLASAYFQREAKARGLNVVVASAGTHPDAQVSPAVASHLKQNGYEVPIATPRRAIAGAVMGRSVGTGAPMRPASVGNQSWTDAISLLTRGAIFPGH